MIKTLNASQESALVDHRNHWQSLACETGRQDPGKIEESIAQLYDAAALVVPEVLVFNSPFQCNLALYILKNDLRLQDRENFKERVFAPFRRTQDATRLDAIAASVWAKLDAMSTSHAWGNLGPSCAAPLRLQLETSLSDDFENAIEDDLWDHLDEALHEALSDAISEHIWRPLKDTIEHSLPGYALTSTPFLGALNAPWLALYDFGSRLGI